MKSLQVSIVAGAAMICATILYSTGKLDDLKPVPIWEKQVLSQLVDPDSAEFRGLVFGNLSKWVCGYVKSKNSYGGYTGWTPFVAQPPLNTDDVWNISFGSDYAISNGLCD